MNRLVDCHVFSERSGARADGCRMVGGHQGAWPRAGQAPGECRLSSHPLTSKVHLFFGEALRVPELLVPCTA